MKKVSTATVKATKNFSQPKLTIGLDLGDRIELVLPARRSGGSAAGTETGHDSEGDARGVRKHAALLHCVGNGDALALGEPLVERTGTRSDRGTCAQRAL